MPRRRRKTFPCGHKGYGRKCHRCAQQQAQQELQAQSLEDKIQEKIEWKESFERDPIDLRALPHHVVRKARVIIAGLQNQQDYREFGGKRLRHNRFIISIPITRNYRMICHDDGDVTGRQAVLSHAQYNVKKPGT